MKLSSHFLPIVLALLTTSGWAQERNPSGQKPPATERVQVERVVLDEVKTVARETTLERTADLTAVENLLIALNEAKPGSAEWRLETAQRLVHLAEQMAREGRPQSVPKLVARALEHLQAADTAGTDPEQRAAAKSLAGFIQERYLADDMAAKASYQAAAQLDPGNRSAKEHAERLQRKDEQARLAKPRG